MLQRVLQRVSQLVLQRVLQLWLVAILKVESMTVELSCRYQPILSLLSYFVAIELVVLSLSSCCVDIELSFRCRSVLLLSSSLVAIELCKTQDLDKA